VSWRFLSYPLDGSAFGYGNGERLRMRQVKSIARGDSSNNTYIEMPAHYGTHIDFPYHFHQDGKTLSEYAAKDFVFHRVAIVEMQAPVSDLLIRPQHLPLAGCHPDTDFLIVKTGFCYQRWTEAYWQRGYGFHPDTAPYIKERLPQVRAIGFDLISLSSYQHRAVGRAAHRAFLIDHEMLIVEEMDLRTIESHTPIDQLIVAPLLLARADGAPCTVLAHIQRHD